MSETDVPIYKLVGRHWKTLPSKGDDVAIRDPKLKQGYLGDLTKKSLIELEDIFKRNEQVLNNKFLLSKLKDKGESLRKRQEEVVKALENAKKQQSHNELPDQKDIHGFEWTGSLTNNTVNEIRRPPRQDIVEDRDDMDPLELMAHHHSSVDHRESRSVRPIDEDPASAIARELEELEISDAKREGRTGDNTFGARRDQMIQKKYEQNGPAKASFKPFKPVKNPKPIPGLALNQKPVQSKPVICISQQEAQKLEKEYLDKQKERELKQTIELLGRPNKISNICEVPSKPMGSYRDANLAKHVLDSDEEEEEKEEEDRGLYYVDSDDDDDTSWN